MSKIAPKPDTEGVKMSSKDVAKPTASSVAGSLESGDVRDDDSKPSKHKGKEGAEAKTRTPSSRDAGVGLGGRPAASSGRSPTAVAPVEDARDDVDLEAGIERRAENNGVNEGEADVVHAFSRHFLLRPIYWIVYDEFLGNFVNTTIPIVTWQTVRFQYIQSIN